MSEKLNIAAAREEVASETYQPAATLEETTERVTRARDSYEAARAIDPAASMDEFSELQSALIVHEANGGTLDRYEAKNDKKEGLIKRTLGRFALRRRAENVEAAKPAPEAGKHSTGSVAPGSPEPGARRPEEQATPISVEEASEKLPIEDADGTRTSGKHGNGLEKVAETVGKHHKAESGESQPGDAESDSDEQEKTGTRKGRIVKFVRMVLGSAGVKKYNGMRFGRHKDRAENIAKIRAEQDQEDAPEGAGGFDELKNRINEDFQREKAKIDRVLSGGSSATAGEVSRAAGNIRANARIEADLRMDALNESLDDMREKAGTNAPIEEMSSEQGVEEVDEAPLVEYSEESAKEHILSGEIMDRVRIDAEETARNGADYIYGNLTELKEEAGRLVEEQYGAVASEEELRVLISKVKQGVAREYIAAHRAAQAAESNAA